MSLALALSANGRVGLGHDAGYTVCWMVTILTWRMLSGCKLPSHYVTFGCTFAFTFTHLFLT